MQKDTFGGIKPPERDLGALDFSARVLDCAADTRMPLMERLRFLSLHACGLDDFFRVRAARLQARAARSAATEALLDEISRCVREQLRRRGEIYRELSEALSRLNIREMRLAELAPDDRQRVRALFFAELRPLLVPELNPPPLRLPDRRCCVAALLRDAEGAAQIGLVPLPRVLPCFLRPFPDRGEFLRTDRLIADFAEALFPACTVEARCVLRLTRGDDLPRECTAEDARLRTLRRMEQRARLPASRLEIDRAPEAALARVLSAWAALDARFLFVETVPPEPEFAGQLAGLFPALRAPALNAPPLRPRWPEGLRAKGSLLRQIEARDRLLFYPYESAEPFLRLLNEAAERPDVRAVCITLYRLTAASRVARALCRAAKNGKYVLAAVELRARFDEGGNLLWSRVLEEAGCRVVHGSASLKCHAKICLIETETGGIVQISTGNYSETACMHFADFCLLSASPALLRDGRRFFRALASGWPEGSGDGFERLRVAPEHFKRWLIQKIDAEAEKGAAGNLLLKVNALTDADIAAHLRAAAQRGAQLRLIVRGCCRLLPQAGEDLRIYSLVGRVLEHARVYRFGRGAAAEYYLASADLMPRNFHRRIEIACPVEDEILKARLDEILSAQLAAPEARELRPDGSYL